jgi:purine-cytosine permease-like protein
MLSVTVAAAGPLSYAPSLGDYSRRISARHGDRRVAGAAAFGVFSGLFATTLFGAFTAVTFTHMGDSYVRDLVAAAPAWYVLPILVIGLAGGGGQGVLNLYASGLDLEALVPRLRRVHTTLITSLVAVGLMFAGTFALDAVDSITAMTLVLNGLAAPWVAVNLAGFYVARRKRYDPEDLQAFNQGRRGGRYWFTGGWNLRAVVPWAAGSAFGLLAVNTTLYVGPLANVADGVDLSLVGSAVIAAVLYVVALRLFPEPEEVRS